MRESNKLLSLKRKKELFLRLQREKGIKSNDKIRSRSRKRDVPVSFIQETALKGLISGLYDPEKTRTSCPYLCYVIKGELKIHALSKALYEIVQRHEVLRTNYKVKENQPYQIINEVPHNAINIVDLHNLKELEIKNETNRIIIKRASDSFNFFKDLSMLRSLLIACKDSYILYITIDHIATDGWSMGLLKKELFTLYESFLKNKPSPLPELPIQFADYAIWERENFSGYFLEKKIIYWKQVARIKNTVLPTDRTPSCKCFDGDTVPLFIDKDLKNKLILLCRKYNVTLFTLLLAALASLIYCFSGYLYNFFSIPFSNRSQKETESLIGCLMDFQYALIDLKGDPEFPGILERTKNALHDAYDNYIPCYFINRDIVSVQDPLVDFQFQTFSEGMMIDIDTIPKDVEVNSILKEIDINLVTEDKQINSSPKGIATGLVSKNMEDCLTLKNIDIDLLAKETKINSSPKDIDICLVTNEAETKSRHKDIKFIPHNIPQPVFALHDISLNLNEMYGQISGNLIYQSALYNRATIINIKNDYIHLLADIANNSKIRISEMVITAR